MSTHTPKFPTKRASAIGHGLTAGLQATSDSSSATRPVADDSAEARIARMNQIVQDACKTPQGARNMLIQAGILTKKGTLRKEYR